jgi:hypothetical protein
MLQNVRMTARMKGVPIAKHPLDTPTGLLLQKEYKREQYQGDTGILQWHIQWVIQGLVEQDVE